MNGRRPSDQHEPVLRSAAREGGRAGLILLAVILSAGFVARVWLAWVDDGIYWPDEIYQSLEPAHRLVFGPGLISWEYGLGARTWALPGLVAAIFWMCQAVGLDDPRQYRSESAF